MGVGEPVDMTGGHMRVGLFALTSLMLAIGGPVLAEDAAGDWVGKLGTLRVGLHLSQASGGSYKGYMLSLDQGGAKIPLDSIVTTPTQLSYHGANAKLGVDGRFEGAWDAAQKAWVGSWAQGGTVPLSFTRVVAPEAAKVSRRPQEEAIAGQVSPFPSVEVRFRNGDVTLAGTFSKPKGEGPFPAVVLIGGTGANNRDEEGFGHKEFVVLADALNRAGIAVLRYDKRGVGASSGQYEFSTTADFAEDGAAAVALLASRSDVDASHIGIVGHSEGAMIAPMIAGHIKTVAFVVLIAGVTVPGDEASLLQLEALDRASHVSEGEIQAKLAVRRQIYALIRAAASPEEARAHLVVAAKPLVEQGLYTQAQADGADALFTSPWWYWALRYDPQSDLQKVSVPVLALYGSLDLQVPPSGHIPALREDLKANSDVTIIELPGLNHLLQHAVTGSPEEYAQIEETLAPEALSTLCDWAAKHSQ